jgi:hypothetical protein
MSHSREYARHSADYLRGLRLSVLFFVALFFAVLFFVVLFFVVLFFAIGRTRAFLTDGFFLAGLAIVCSSPAIALVNQVPAGFSKNISRLLNLRVPGLK